MTTCYKCDYCKKIRSGEPNTRLYLYFDGITEGRKFDLCSSCCGLMLTIFKSKGGYGT